MVNEKILSNLKTIIPKENIKINEPMKNHTSFKIGGPAEIFIEATSMEQIKLLVEFVSNNNIALYIIGNGSNLLVNDKGIEGIVLKSKLNNIEIEDNKNYVQVKAGSGVVLAYLAHKLLESGITGFEELAGIPGTIGGAIRMNAGAHGKEMKDIVISTTYMDMQGNIHTISNLEHEFKYRNSMFFKHNYIILETVLKLQNGNKEKIKEKMAGYMAWRKEKQPLEYPNAGSTFKRGDGFITAQLIDECNLKGYTIGGAQVSEKHAGFIINANNATAKDVLELIDYVKEQVYSKTGKKIELEIEVI